MDAGECHGLFEVYGYNTTSKRCEPFYYGGCGTENEFEYEAGCKRVCIDKKPCGPMPRLEKLKPLCRYIAVYDELECPSRSVVCDK
uniref:BPTI/Kunitz inhibitor domain-containing protein n=1 Tax=Romanomermis culicivorax TaxID=13658 RepID=A0A915I4D2_ROMCU